MIKNNKGVIMSNSKLNGVVAALESKVDLLETELSYLNRILVKCGFPEGIKTLKSTVEDLLKEGIISPSQEEKPTLPGEF